MITGKYSELYEDLSKFIPKERLIHDELRKLTYGTDASFYRLLPKLVIKADNEDEVVTVIKHCDKYNIPVTFRAAGTSLSGQSITDSVLLLLSHNWKDISITKDGAKITLQPGVVGGHANQRLAPYYKKLGPDPASINSAKISGIAANNASGMTSGTKQNIYNTLSGMRIVLSDGAVVDTRDEKSKEAFRKSHSSLIEAIENLSGEVKNNPALKERIEAKYSMKNTTGLGINSLIEFDDPFDILAHLMIGSEGTLGFISDITLNTVPEYPFKGTALIPFENIKTACSAIPIFRELPVFAAEIMDRAALKSVEDKPGMPEYLKTLNEEAAALLVETSAETGEELQKRIKIIEDSIAELPKAHPVEFTTDLKEYKKLWDVRKGLFPSVCSSRKPGTTVIIEDVNFPTDRLADATLDLQALFKKHGYNDTIIWGHSLAGNLHFVFSQDFQTESEVNRYKIFMDEIAKLVVEKYDGSLKAEHGTGRNMAPFVEYEWGKEAYELMRKVKSLLDPKEILNPGVIINNDKKVHLKNLKPMPIADKLIDKCIECGFCEVQCPSRDITLTPRQRIVAYREMSRLTKSGDDLSRLNTLKEAYDYYGNQTCATDGLCAIACPVEINTGNLIKKLRSESISKTADSIASFLAEHMKLVTESARIGLNFVQFFQKILGDTLMGSIATGMRKVSGNLIPQWNKYMPKGADSIYPATKDDKPLKVVYFPSCISRSMGISKDSECKDAQTTIMHKLLQKAGYEIIYPSNLGALCCGMPFASKGFVKQGAEKAEELIKELKQASNNGEYPVLFDTSPCLYRIKEFMEGRGANGQLNIYETVEFISDFMLDKLTLKKKKDTIALHVTCSSKKMGLDDKFRKVAEACVENVFIPENMGCCGFAGDRGFTHPELNASALKDLKESLPEECDHGYSNSRTCEIGLSLHSGIEYRSIVYLVDECLAD